MKINHIKKFRNTYRFFNWRILFGKRKKTLHFSGFVIY